MPVNGDDTFKGATLKMIILPSLLDDESDDDEDEDDYNMADLLDASSEDDDEEDDEEVNGGPSDPEKSPKALKRREAMEKLKEALKETREGDMDVDATNGINGTKSSKDKGKAKATDVDQESDEDELVIELPEGSKEVVLCTLDLSKVIFTTLHFCCIISAAHLR